MNKAIKRLKIETKERRSAPIVLLVTVQPRNSKLGFDIDQTISNGKEDNREIMGDLPPFHASASPKRK